MQSSEQLQDIPVTEMFESTNLETYIWVVCLNVAAHSETESTYK